MRYSWRPIKKGNKPPVQPPEAHYANLSVMSMVHPAIPKQLSYVHLIRQK